ncbi:recombinase family protein [Bradyrhizobium ottawaense]|uniref:recombinase family protein n=1 Tax=Bradyrhizobium ottawaense TaxID=931866 RepID=UPI0015CF77B1
MMANAPEVHKAHLVRSQLGMRAAKYVRMSTQRQQYSIQNQAAVIAAYAHAHSLTIVRTYRDEGESGLPSRTGPALCSSSRMSKQEKPILVIFWSMT